MSDRSYTAIQNELSKILKIKLSNSAATDFNIEFIKVDDGLYKIHTPFLNIQFFKSILSGTLNWINANGKTLPTGNLLIDLKFSDKSLSIASINKLKFILTLNEDLIYRPFPTRLAGIYSRSIKRDIELLNVPSVGSIINLNPRLVSSGINFETLNDGFLRHRYIGGNDYTHKIQSILDIVDDYVNSVIVSITNPKLTEQNVNDIKKLIVKFKKLKESYLDYELFHSHFPKIDFTVDLKSDKLILQSYYFSIRDRIFDLVSNIKGDLSFELNYDTIGGTLQIHEATLTCYEVANIDFISCKLLSGKYNNCSFYSSELNNSLLNMCNLYKDTTVTNSRLVNSMTNRTTTVTGCIIDGMNGVINGKVVGGVIIQSKVGELADISKETKVLKQTKLKSGYFVAGDKVIIPSKQFFKY